MSKYTLGKPWYCVICRYMLFSYIW